MSRVPAFAAAVSIAFLAARPAAAQPITPQIRVNGSTANTQGQPAITRSIDNGYIVVWTSDIQPGHGIFGRRLDVLGVPISGGFRVNSVTTFFVGHPSVAADSSGNFVVVWNGYQSDGGQGIFGQRYLSDGTPTGTEFRINANSTLQTNFSEVAYDSSGNFVVVWERVDASVDIDVFGRRYAGSGAPLVGTFRVNESTTGFQGIPRVATGPSGFIVTFTSQSPSGGNEVLVRRYDASGAPLGGEYRTNASTVSAGEQDVASLGDGRFFVVWEDSDGTDFNAVVARRFSASGSPLGSPFRVNTYTTNLQQRPRVTSDAHNNYVVVWQSIGQDGSGTGIYGQRIANSGAALGPEFQVNTHLAGDQGYPAVAASVLKDYFAVVFSDDDGSGTGIWMRGFCLKGDANGDGAVDVADVFYLINALFAGGPAPIGCSDVNADLAINVGDVFYLINFLFANGPSPV
jgi:dockerin type I repeat protein